MRFLCLAVSAIAVIAAIVFGVMTGSAKSYVEKNTPAYEKFVAETKTLREKTLQLDTENETLTVKRDELKAEVELLTLQEHYKNNCTAFLTFDDGSSAQTLKILDTLKEYNIKATFFVVTSTVRNNGATAREAIQRIVDEGHILAIHCNKHEYNKLYTSAADYFADFDAAVEYLASITDYKPYIVRLPSGTMSARDFCSRYGGSTDVYYDIVSELYERGYTVIDWNVDSQDWNEHTSQAIVDNVTKAAKTKKNSTYKNSVVLMHDIYARTAEALPLVIENLQEMGYGFDSLDNLIKAKLVTRQVAATSKP